MSKKNTPQSKNPQSQLLQNAPDMNFSPQNNFELTGVTPPQQRGIHFRAATFEYSSRLPQPNPNENPFYVNKPFVPPQRPNTDYHQEPGGSSYRPNMDFLHCSQHYQDYSPIRSTNLDMNLDDWGDYPTPQYSTQNYPSQDASMGQGSGHGSYHGSMPFDEDDDVEEISPVKPKKPSRCATKAKDKGKQPEPNKKVEPWTQAEEIALCRAFIFISKNDKKGNAMNRHCFWELLIKYFQKETCSDRTYDSIMSKWKTRIRGRVVNFCAIMDNVKYTHGSGENDADAK
jgi:hypothetical protein